MLFRFEKIDSPLCSFCKMVDETPFHFFYNCTKIKLLRDQLQELVSNTTSIPSLTPQSSILGHIDLSDDFLFINYLILIYKFDRYNSRNRGYRNMEHLKAITDKSKSTEEEISKHEPKIRSKIS